MHFPNEVFKTFRTIKTPSFPLFLFPSLPLFLPPGPAQIARAPRRRRRCSSQGAKLPNEFRPGSSPILSDSRRYDRVIEGFVALRALLLADLNVPAGIVIVRVGCMCTKSTRGRLYVRLRGLRVTFPSFFPLSFSLPLLPLSLFPSFPGEIGAWKALRQHVHT